ncbi:uncharacterized protein LOC132171297 [Corylus avellana]|uniref:uncharacterized protein LOC132171297 n=1 Tax=Corylus avellana TaxID=13451 RepID=UPI00286A3876|nr:uncharacterized protein LOC132171297 [Corylus avellana]XP_059438565.1 uncharacterized protein LOC132171297 [Corylus avellana]
MGFNFVYRCLQEVFPKVDSRLLRAVAIEHPKDADQAVDVVLKEIIPYLSGQSTSPTIFTEDNEVESEEQMDLLSQQQVIEKPDVGPSSEPLPIDGEAAKETDHTGSVLHADATPLVEALNESLVSDFYDANDGNDQSCVYTENEEVILLGKAQENSAKVGLNQIVPATSNDQKQICENTKSEELISWGTSKVGPELTPPAMTTSSVNEWQEDLENDWKDFDFPMADNFDADHAVIHGESHNAESCSDSTEVRNVVAQLVLLSVEGHTPVAGGSSDITLKQDSSVSEMSDLEDEPKRDTMVTHSGKVCKIDLLEEIIEDAKNNKKTLFLAMERVINMMREVELQEKAAEQAKEEASRGELNILIKVEEMKQMLAHAKEANNMHAGEVYGEKAILATEVRELQSRLLSVSDERDKSLAILDEMHQILEARLAIAEELRKAAEQERLEKEESARNAFAEQEAIMEKVIQESKMLEQEAEENSKLREFLMDRGRTVDILQGEISVICQDVRLLKEKFDDRVPLSKSVSSSQTSCILATTSGSSLKSMASDLVPGRSLASSGSSLTSAVPEQGESSETPKKTSPTSSVHSPSLGSGDKEEAARAVKALLDEGWDFFDQDAELDN